MDNSKRITYGISAYTANFKSALSQTYEFTNNSNFHAEQGNEDNLSDLLGSIEYFKNNELSYNFRYDINDEYLKKQNVKFYSPTSYGDLNLSYLLRRAIASKLLVPESPSRCSTIRSTPKPQQKS